MYTITLAGSDVLLQRQSAPIEHAQQELIDWISAGNTLDLPAEDRAAIFQAYKDQRNARLTASDWAVLPDVVTRGTLTQAQQDAYMTYRSDLYWWLYNNGDQQQPKTVEELITQAWPVEPVV